MKHRSLQGREKPKGPVLEEKTVSRSILVFAPLQVENPPKPFGPRLPVQLREGPKAALPAPSGAAGAWARPGWFTSLGIPACMGGTFRGKKKMVLVWRGGDR